MESISANIIGRPGVLGAVEYKPPKRILMTPEQAGSGSRVYDLDGNIIRDMGSRRWWEWFQVRAGRYIYRDGVHIYMYDWDTDTAIRLYQGSPSIVPVRTLYYATSTHFWIHVGTGSNPYYCRCYRYDDAANITLEWSVNLGTVIPSGCTDYIVDAPGAVAVLKQTTPNNSFITADGIETLNSLSPGMGGGLSIANGSHFSNSVLGYRPTSNPRIFRYNIAGAVDTVVFTSLLGTYRFKRIGDDVIYIPQVPVDNEQYFLTKVMGGVSNSLINKGAGWWGSVGVNVYDDGTVLGSGGTTLYYGRRMGVSLERRDIDVGQLMAPSVYRSDMDRDAWCETYTGIRYPLS